MTAPVDNASSPEPADTGAVKLGFPAIEALQEASLAVGWDGEYRQIEAGQLEASTCMRQLGNVSLIREATSRRLEVAMSSPEDAFTLLVSTSGRETPVFNGHGVHDDTAVLLSPGTEIHSIAPAGAAVLNIHIDEDVLGSYVRGMLQQGSRFETRGAARALKLGPDIARLRALSTCAMRLGADAATENDLEVQFIERVVQGIEFADPAGRKECKYHRLRKSNVLMRLADYVGENLGQRLTLFDLCNVGNVSQSTLQRLCQQEFGLSPYEYVQARRLDAARRQLQIPGRTMTIAQIAQEVGFNHTGRFAACYRRQFGVLPSEFL